MSGFHAVSVWSCNLVTPIVVCVDDIPVESGKHLVGYGSIHEIPPYPIGPHQLQLKVVAGFENIRKSLDTIRFGNSGNRIDQEVEFVLSTTFNVVKRE